VLIGVIRSPLRPGVLERGDPPAVVLAHEHERDDRRPQRTGRRAAGSCDTQVFEARRARGPLSRKNVDPMVAPTMPTVLNVYLQLLALLVAAALVAALLPLALEALEVVSRMPLPVAAEPWWS
jgi:hypothetical protein